tara:strand:+ start:1342 stop:1581 length:240 start_codon:yes stop_codon:yes gene_type:complete
MKKIQIKKIIELYFFKILKKKINNKTKIISNELIDSLGTIELINFIEKEFKIHLKENDLTIKKLDTIDSISNLIFGKIK